MEKLNFETGLKKFAINGDENRILLVNPSDLGFFERYKKVTDELNDIKAWLEEEKEGAEVDVIDVMARAGAEARKAFDHLFYDGACNIVFGNVNPLTPVGGKAVMENFLEAFIVVVEPFIKKEADESEKRMSKYKNMYEQLKHDRKSSN